MTRAGRAIRNFVERWLDRYNEGPEPPARLAEEVRLFAILHATATPEEWADFTTRLAQKAYREGYTRGWEYSERFWPGPPDDPEVIAASSVETVSLTDLHPRLKMILDLGYDPADPFAGMTHPERKAFLEEMARGANRGTLRKAPR